MFKQIANTCAILITLWSTQLASGHVYKMGECPTVEPMPEFDMDKFLGEWFVVQKFRSTSDCVMENFTKVDTGDYHVTRTANFFGSPVVTTVSGTIAFTHNETQAEMDIDYPLSHTGAINIRSYTVLATDYSRYALVWNCQPMLIGHRQSAQIMSRNGTLDRKMVAELRELLAGYQLNDHYLSIVRQSDCQHRLEDPYDGFGPDFGPNIIIGAGDKPIVSVGGGGVAGAGAPGGPDCDRPAGKKPGKRGDTRSGISVRVGPFHFSAMLPF